MSNEILYRSSQWAKRFATPKEVIENFVKVISEISEENRKRIPCELDLSYGDCDDDKFDYFGVDLPEEAPIFLYIHGGYWQNMNRKISSFMVEPLYKNGIKVIALGYTFCPKVTLFQIVDNVKRGVQKALETAKYTSSRKIMIGGHSCGAQLAISLFEKYFKENPSLSADRINEVFLISGIYDLIPLVSTTINDPLKLDEESAEALSPFYKEIPAKVIPRVGFRIFVGEHEGPAFIEQSKNFHEKLLAGNCRSTFEVLEDLDHFNIVEMLSREDFVITEEIIKCCS